jgi:hypothetical protein
MRNKRNTINAAAPALAGVTATLKRSVALATVCTLGVAAQAQLIDDFTGDLSAYTATRILNASTADADNVYAWEIGSGSLQLRTTSYGGIEQYALTRTDFPLAVGYELIASYSHLNLNSQDIGLYVGAGHPTMDVRADYVNIYVRNNGQIFSRGFNGTTEFGLAGGSTPANISSLFISRTGANTFELGFYDGSIRNVLTTRAVSNGDIGNAIGFYADIRQAGVRGNLDNLTIALIPEPSSFAMLGMGGLGMLMWRRRQ